MLSVGSAIYRLNFKSFSYPSYLRSYLLGGCHKIVQYNVKVKSKAIPVTGLTGL
jgi:hypothetical protein